MFQVCPATGRPIIRSQHAAIRFHARPVGDARQLASAPQGTYLAGKPSNVCFAELRAGRVFLRGHSGSGGRSLWLVPSLRPFLGPPFTHPASRIGICFLPPRHDFFSLDAGALRKNRFGPILCVAYSEIRPLCARLSFVFGKSQEVTSCAPSGFPFTLAKITP